MTPLTAIVNSLENNTLYNASGAYIYIYVCVCVCVCGNTPAKT